MTVNELILSLQQLASGGHGDKTVTLSDWSAECYHPLILHFEDINIVEVKFLHNDTIKTKREVIILGGIE